MRRVIPKEQVAGYQRWQLGSFDQPAPANPASTSAAAPSPAEPTVGETIVEMPFPTADELARINDDARSEGYRDGHAEGLAAGRAAAEAESAEHLARLQSLVGNLQVSLAHLDQEIAEQLLDFGLEVAAQIVRSSLSVDRQLLLPAIREALGELPFHHGSVTLHMNPADATSLQEAIKEQLAHTGVHVVPDSGILAGGCLIKAGSSEIDATVETRWRRVLEAIGATPREWLNRP